MHLFFEALSDFSRRYTGQPLVWLFALTTTNAVFTIIARFSGNIIAQQITLLPSPFPVRVEILKLGLFDCSEALDTAISTPELPDKSRW